MIDKLYYINLDKRTDRLKHLKENILPHLQLPGMKQHRVPAVDHTHYNHICQRAAGCSLSHMSAWKDAILNKYDKVIIIEDDIQLIEDPHKIISCLQKISDMEISVCNLGYNNMKPLFESKYENFYRCTDVQTASFYVASVKFLEEILPTVEVATVNLMNFESYPKNGIDQVWKKFQNRADWLLTDRMVKQMKSHSDLERREVDYGV